MQSKGTQLANIDKAGMLARVEGAKFPTQLTRPEKEMLAQAAVDYGLDPLTGELTIYQGHLYVTIDGRIRKAHETGKFEGIESRPATKEEREARGTPVEHKLWRSDAYRTGCTRPFTGWGEVLDSEQTGNAFLPTVSRPDRMAEKRSQQAALRLGFYLPLPGIEEAGVEAEPVTKNAITEDGRQVDTASGEIKETITAEFTESPGEASLSASGPVSNPPAESKAEPEKAPAVVKDETAVTVEHCQELLNLMKQANLTLAEVAYSIKNDKVTFLPKESWANVKKLADLKMWQYAELKTYLSKAAGLI